MLCCIPKQEGPKFKAILGRREEGRDGGREEREVRTKERMIEGRGAGGGEGERRNRSWRGSSEVKNVSYSCKGLGYSSQHPREMAVF